MKKFFILFIVSNFYALEIKEAVICEKIIDRKPSQVDTLFKSGAGWLYCWCRLKTDKPCFIYHEWVYKDSIMARIKLPVNFASENYRIWSRKRIFSLWIGEWRVLIKNERDSILKEIKFKITE